MLFNSYIFIFAFLPATFIIFWGLQKAGKNLLALQTLALASLLFYAYWNPPFILLLAGSILFNFTAGNIVARKDTFATLAFWSGIAVNLALIAYFKYAAFGAGTVNALFGTSLDAGDIFLPLGISFFTFQQITYLLDIRIGKIKPARLRDYTLFVSFFPHLIAGPIVQAWEIIPQISNFAGRKHFWTNMAVGVSIFITGLFKKVFIADNLALFATPVFAQAHENLPVSFFDGWCAALAYTFQLYFDFSGYSDMAIGLGLMFGITLPVNFLSPYKATSIKEFWERWHITMSRFFRDYIYIPLGGNRVNPLRRVLNLVITMFLAGLWHGAGWTFALWGLLHGLYLVINHLFTYARKKFTPHVKTDRFAYKAAAHILTMLAVVIGWVFFRAENFSASLDMLRAMAGLDGIIVPNRVAAITGLDAEGWLRAAGAGEQWLRVSPWCFPWLAASYALCLAAPASVEFFGQTEEKPGRLSFKPDVKTAVALALMGMIALFSMQRVSEFLYFQFLGPYER